MLTIADVKARLRTIHDADDALIEKLLASATEEAVRFCNLWDTEFNMALVPDSDMFDEGVLLLVASKFDAYTPSDIAAYRRAVETVLMPLRMEMGA